MRYCGMCGRALATRPASGERERRRVSVVFVDLMGFSTLTHGLDPEELRDLADEVLTMVAGVVEDYDGYVDAFRGDGLSAVFGAPHSHPDDPYRAVVAASASLRAIERIGQERSLDLHGRAGVTTGMVVAGAVGSGRVREYTVMGSVVNLASRLEGAARAGSVLVGFDTYEATRHRLTYAHVDDLSLAGFPNVTSAYEFVADREREADPYRRLPFVGRARELAALDATLAQVRERGRAAELWLVGEAGSGKTRLMQTFAERAEANTTVVRLATQRLDDPTDGGPNWSALAEQVLGVRASDDDRTRSQRAREQLQRLLPDDTRAHRLILSSLGLVARPTWTRLERRSVDRAALAWRDALSAVARSNPGHALVIAVASERYAPHLDAFASVLATCDGPILVVRLSRGRDLPPDAARLSLQPLTTAESLSLLDQVVDPVFRTAARALVEQVGGVPAAIFELARALAITQDTNVSSSLVSLLQTRIDGFEPSARRMLAVAALAGERSWEDLLLEAVPEGRSALNALRDADALVPDGDSSLPGQPSYRFRSELLRRAVLHMIPFGERPSLHLRIATWLEEHAPLAFSESIAQHFEKGGAIDAAYAHYLAGAAEALSDGDRPRCERLYEAITRLDVDAEAAVQAALAHAEAALQWQASDVAEGALARAEARIDACPPEAAPRLREALSRLHDDLRAARRLSATPA